MDVIESIKQEKVVAVIRAKDDIEAIDIVKACIAGGIKIIEITFTIPDAHQVISKLHQVFKDQIILGAGTVINKTMCKAAIGAGAQFIVSPGLETKTANYCRKNNVPYLPGCMTPSEMMKAMALGVKMIKLFPGSLFEPSYIQAIKGPFPEIAIMPTGGVNLNNIKKWFDCGASAVGIGSALTKPAINKDFKQITTIAKAYMDSVSGVI